MTFSHSPLLLSYSDLEVSTGPSGRVYETPEGRRYPSVTTVLGYGKSGWVEDWKKTVGEEEAARVSHHATHRGTIVHEMMERYVKDGSLPVKPFPHHARSFKLLKERVDKHLTTVYGQELALYSDELRLAGRTDLVGEWDGCLSIIDYKTSKRPKTRDEISSYFLQETAYSVMLEERTGLVAQQVVIVMDVDYSSPLVFVEDRSTWTEPLRAAVDAYYRDHKELLEE